MATEDKRVFVVSRDDNWLRNSREIVTAIGFSIETFSSFNELVQGVASYEGEGCVLIDFAMDNMNSAAMNSRMIEANVALPAVIVVSDSDASAAKQEIVGITFGIILKSISPTQFRSALEEAFGHQKYVQHQVAVQRNYRRLTNLTERERSIVDLVVDGAPNKKIATNLGLSIKTIERVRQSAYRKLDVRSTAEMTKVVILGDLHDIVCIDRVEHTETDTDSTPVIAPLIPPPMGLSRNFVNG